MIPYVLKLTLTSLVIVAVSEIGKRSTLMAGILASLPLTSLLALVWLYQDTSDAQAAARLSTSIFWMVLPSLLFFVAFPVLIRLGLRFYPALLIASVLMAVAYAAYNGLLKQLGVDL